MCDITLREGSFQTGIVRQSAGYKNAHKAPLSQTVKMVLGKLINIWPDRFVYQGISTWWGSEIEHKRDGELPTIAGESKTNKQTNKFINVILKRNYYL